MKHNNQFNHMKYSFTLVTSLLLLFTHFLIKVDASTNQYQANRTIDFAGHQWVVKSGCDLGPGPNCWSDSTDSVWVDEAGRLHLTIKNINGEWHSSEVRTTACTQYGMHRFYFESRMDQYDKNIIAAPFLYKDDQHEIDIEFSTWGADSPTYNAGYTVQPYTTSGNNHSFQMNLNGLNSTHYIDWQASSVKFKSIHGHYAEPPAPHFTINEWLYTGNNIPSQEDCLKIHINFWLLNGNPPSNNQEAELIISNLDSPKGSIVYLPMVQKAPENWITLQANADFVSGSVGPEKYCNSNYKVKLYALIDSWYIQPHQATPDIEINPDCSWQSATNDWYRLSASLVSREFNPPFVLTGDCPLWDADESTVITTTCSGQNPLFPNRSAGE